MAAADDKCLFSPCNGKGKLQTFKSVAVQKIISTSKAKCDDLFAALPSSEILAHKSCYCSYTSKTRNAAQKKRKGALGDAGSCKRMLKSSCGDFQFKRDCIFCGKECLPKDPKNPGRWVPVIQCTTVDRDGGISFKQHIENICDERQDQWAQDVTIRFSGVIDLHAADAQYHKHCYNSFRVVPKKLSSTTMPLEEAMKSIISKIAQNVTETWTTSELYSMYTAASGHLSRKQFVSNVKAHFGAELLVLHIEGCESVLGFEASLGRVMKIVKVSNSQGCDDQVDKLVRSIRSEVMAMPRPGDYNLGDFVYQRLVQSTSKTLLKLVSSLVSDGFTTKQSLTLAQCIQQHIGGANRNQTTLGLAVKLHHKHGSSELIRTLNEHGITCTYEEVLRFRKSVANFVSDNHTDYHNKLGLSAKVGPIFSWADNYDLYIASPNGIKTTHAMVMEFTQHPAGIIETGNIGVMQLTIPRLRKHEASSSKITKQVIQTEHYTGPSKVNPPHLPTKNLLADELQLQSAAVTFSQQQDAAWLSQIHGSDKPVEWAGFNAQQVRLEGSSVQKPKTLVVFGPMIDSPPAHPDTVLTTLVHLEKCLTTFGMQYIHVTVDMQLYQLMCLVQWNDPDRWCNLILHPGMMHTLMSFLGCIGTLMKASGLEVLISAAFDSISSIINGKARTKFTTSIPSHHFCAAEELLCGCSKDIPGAV